jgi:hypothetical protein
MRHEHCGNFSVAHIVMSAEALQQAGGYPRLEGRRVARCFHARGETVVQATLSVLHARPAQSSERKVLKVRGLRIIA